MSVLLTARGAPAAASRAARAVWSRLGGTAGAAAAGVPGARRHESVFANYDEISPGYDAARFAVAAPAIRQTLDRIAATVGRPVDELVALEAGCGTGNYTVALAEMGVARVHAFDGNEGMLEQLRAKVAAAAPGSPVAQAVAVGESVVDLAADPLRLPLDDGSIHCAMVPQVTHHLVRDGMEDPFDRVQALVRELGRVVAPGGAVVIQTSTPEQQQRGFWWADIIPGASLRLSRRFSDVPTWKTWLREAGFTDGPVKTEVPAEPLTQLSKYLEAKGPLRAEYRGWDSCWELATPEELDAGLRWYEQLVEAGRAEGYVAEREGIRALVGQTTTLIAHKPL